MRREKDILWEEEGKVRIMYACDMEIERMPIWREEISEVQVTWRRSVGQRNELLQSIKTFV